MCCVFPPPFSPIQLCMARSHNDHFHQTVHVGRIFLDTARPYASTLRAMRTIELYWERLCAHNRILIFRTMPQLKMMHQWAMLTVHALMYRLKASPESGASPCVPIINNNYDGWLPIVFIIIQKAK